MIDFCKTRIGNPSILQKVSVPLKLPHNEAVHILPINNYNDLFLICEWKPNLTLDNQSEDTIKKIYSILI